MRPRSRTAEINFCFMSMIVYDRLRRRPQAQISFFNVVVSKKESQNKYLMN